MPDMELMDEMEQLKVDSVYADLNDSEKGKILKKLLGPLLNQEVLTPKESAYFFLASAHGKTTREIGTIFGVSHGSAGDVVGKAKGKIRAYRKGRYWDA